MPSILNKMCKKNLIEVQCGTPRFPRSYLLVTARLRREALEAAQLFRLIC